MTTLLLIRHAVNEWVKTNKLAGWTPGVHLNEDGQAQAEALGVRLADQKLHAIYASPLERTMETAQSVAAHHPHLTIQHCEGMGEVDFGKWQGEKIATLARRKMWHVIQYASSRAYFPGGETMRGAQVRAVDTLEALAQNHPQDVVAVFSHSDIIKLVVAYYLGMPIDMFQRVVISPASISVIRLGYGRPFVVQVNDTSHHPKKNTESTH